METHLSEVNHFANVAYDRWFNSILTNASSNRVANALNKKSDTISVKALEQVVFIKLFFHFIEMRKSYSDHGRHYQQPNLVDQSCEDKSRTSLPSSIKIKHMDTLASDISFDNTAIA